MELSSHVVANLDQWVEDGFINIEQREAIAQLMEGTLQDAYEHGLAQSDDGYDSGWDDGYDAGFSEVQGKRDEWFQEGWAEALLEHGIEE